MIVMPANNAKMEVGYLAGRYPGRVGWLLGPNGWKTPKPWLPYAIDNGRFIATTQGKLWDEAAFVKLIERAAALEFKPLWVVVPDVVGDRERTLTEWALWAPRIAAMGFTLAMAAQDGMTPADIPAGAVCFLGGSVQWKRRNLYLFGEACPRLHVGRINTGRWLWHCHRAGAESCDGTGWFRGDPKQTAGLFRYLERSSNGEHEHNHRQATLFTQGGSHGDPCSETGKSVSSDGAAATTRSVPNGMGQTYTGETGIVGMR